jgi:hypothetical protein
MTKTKNFQKFVKKVQSGISLFFWVSTFISVLHEASISMGYSDRCKYPESPAKSKQHLSEHLN